MFIKAIQKRQIYVKYTICNLKYTVKNNEHINFKILERARNFKRPLHVLRQSVTLEIV